MDRETRTRSGRWEIIGTPDDPRAKWVHKPGDDWQSKGDGNVDLPNIKKWVEDMEEWSEMMYEAVLELRGRVALIEGVRQQELVELAVGHEQLAERIRAVEGRAKTGS